MTINLQIYVFSFNREKFLENCLQSITDFAGRFPIHIIDDGSDDEGTVRILSSWTDRANIIYVNYNATDYKVGGLYNNMNLAFQHAEDHGVEFALFLQDDMQLVRNITDLDLQTFQIFFETNLNSVQLHTCFMKLSYREYEDSNTYLDPTKQAYFRMPGEGVFAGFCATGIFHVQRFSRLLDKLIVNKELNESANNARAEVKGIQMGIYAYPFMMFLPMPIAFRNKKRNPINRLVEMIGGAGFFPYQYMNEEKVRQLFERDLLERAYAEKYLTCPGVEHLPLWAFSGGTTVASARGGWRKFLGILVSYFDIARKFRKFKRIVIRVVIKN